MQAIIVIIENEVHVGRGISDTAYIQRMEMSIYVLGRRGMSIGLLN